MKITNTRYVGIEIAGIVQTGTLCPRHANIVRGRDGVKLFKIRQTKRMSCTACDALAAAPQFVCYAARVR